MMKKEFSFGIVPLQCVNEQWQVLLVQHQAGHWAFPKGHAEIGEEPKQTAERELLEETGLVAKEWALLLTMHLSNSVSDELAYLYIAKDLEQHNPEPEETEQLELRKLPLAEAFRMVDEGIITDSMSVAALLKVKSLL